MTVYGEDDLSGEFAVDGSGQIQLPLVGQIKAADLTVHQFIAEVQQILGAKYLRDPRVSVQIETYRPFYIIGEVNRPGEYPCESRLSAFGAVALAGGFTFRADTRRVYVRRNGTGDEEEIPTNVPTRINPGDVVRVAERLFTEALPGVADGRRERSAAELRWEGLPPRLNVKGDCSIVG